ncbi:VOC family protein [Amycolatopsis sp. NPDC059657]|uniref:VOC family protein n=1 Tax=Amycolatopsis sp. NPDC059657 TaxID=3346899 RepID=UPI00366A6CE7
MRTRIIAITIDCHDAEALASFWQQALAYPDLRRWRDGHGLTYVEIHHDGEMPLLFQPVGEGKKVKNRVHLDIAPAELDQYDEIARLTTLGAHVLEDDPAEQFVVLSDPEGNEFCVLPRKTP